MGYLPKELEAVIRPFETEGGSFSQIKVAETVRSWIRDQRTMDAEVKFAAEAEDLAFFFDAAGLSEWGTHFGPTFGGSPDISEVTGPILEYWSGRCREAQHPVLRARYADLVWDFSKPVRGKRASHEFARSAIEAYIEAAEKDLCEPDGVSVFHLRRALSLAISLRDSQLIAKVRESLLTLYRRSAAPKMMGIWSSLFDTLYGNKRVPLPPKEERELIDTLEGLLRRFSDRTNRDFDPWDAKAAAVRLAKHYESTGRRDDAIRVIRAWGLGFEKLASEADAPLAMAWLDDLRDEYRQHDMKEDAARVQLESKAKGALAPKSMMRQAVEVSLSQAELEKWLSEVTAGGLEKALGRIASQFTVREGDARGQLQRTAADHPLLGLIPRDVICDGHVVGRVGGLGDDPEGRVALEIAQTTAFKSQFLLLSLHRLMELYKPRAADIVDYLLSCPLFDAERRGLLERGLGAWLDGDHVAAMHLVLPQVEHVLRRLLQCVGIPTNKPDRRGWMQEKNVWDVLTDASLLASPIGEYLPYLRTLLADPRGLNLRNRLCHGLMGPNEFSAHSSALVLHALLLLSQIRILGQQTDSMPA